MLEGKEEMRLEMAENLLTMGLSISKVIQATKLLPETVQAMADKLPQPEKSNFLSI